ncbi:phosphotransferase family protein [Streptomyces sp. NPDC056230]|uniref:phosphotransferase family protein n=1 Tax=Streptomyces sp. NPDC056230 TaxID=3345754 RepID=UPI0035D693D7
MSTAHNTEHADTGPQEWERSANAAWVEQALTGGEYVSEVVRLHGGATSEMLRLTVDGPAGQRALVLRNFIEPRFARQAQSLLKREADVLRMLEDADVPTASLVAVDATGDHSGRPCLLMSVLPGEPRIQDAGADRRIELLANALRRIHDVRLPPGARPQTYEAWIKPEDVPLPKDSSRTELWQRAVDVIREPPPAYQGRFLHRDFHPGNVLFTGPDDDPRISGVVDWVETSWGPADLDVAHCSTALAVLHGVPAGMRFADLYLAVGGRLTEDRTAHLYWRLLAALVYAPNVDRLAVPLAALGRTELTADTLTARLEDYLQAVFERFG